MSNQDTPSERSAHVSQPQRLNGSWVVGLALLGACALFSCSALLGCGAAPAPLQHQAPAPSAPAPQLAKPRLERLVVLGTNDMHGAVERMPVFAGYLDNLKASLSPSDAYILVDAGDISQGSLESNLGEGDVMIQAMNWLGYSAAAVGNHEFDFGPVGDARDGDPQGALRARIAEANFPFLAANLLAAVPAPAALPRWKNLDSSRLVEIAGVKVGLIGLSTPETPRIVLPSFIQGLSVTDPLPALSEQAKALRAQGASVVIVAAHLGGSCTALEDSHAVSSCDPKQEAMRLVERLEPGLVDVLVGGHTHKAMAHEVHGVAVVESYAKLQAFSRVDLRLSAPVGLSAGRAGQPQISSREIYPPQAMCDDASGRPETCQPGSYAGRPVTLSAQMQALIAPALARAKAKRLEPLYVDLKTDVTRSYDKPSALGDLFADLTLAAARRLAPISGKSAADLAVANGGGLRADMQAGPLTYGTLFNAMPFDNLLARVRLTGAELKQVFAQHLLKSEGGLLSVAGISVRATCHGGRPRVELVRPDQRRIGDAEVVWLATSDYLATGGDGLLRGIELAADAVKIEPELVLRDAMAAELRARAQYSEQAGLGVSTLDAASYFSADKPRIQGADARPLCASR